MAGQTRLGIYNPQISPLDTLASMLVKHQGLLAELVDKHLAQSTFSVLTGISGSGKTHLLRLFEQRISSAGGNVKIVSLRLYQGEITDYFDFVLSLLTAIDYPEKELLQLPTNQALTSAHEILQQAASTQRLLITIEHLDAHLHRLSDKTQKSLKTLFNTTPGLGIFATAGSPLDDKKPLTPLFETYPLTPLSLEEAMTLMRHVALLDDKTDLAESLATSKGKVCVQAFHHLAQGLPRFYVMFAKALRSDPQEEFNDVVLQILDALSVQYDKGITHLPSQQQKLLGFIADQSCTVSVTDIAHHNRITHQTTSGQLKKLRDNGLLVATAVGRTSHYELAQPLMRMALGLSGKTRHQIYGSIELLRHWYASASAGYQAKDGQHFIYHRQHLLDTCLPKQMQIPDSLEHDTQRYLSQLPDVPPLQFEQLLNRFAARSNDVRLSRDEHEQLNHLSLLSGFVLHSLSERQIDYAEKLLHLLFDFTELTGNPTLLKALCKHFIAISAWFASLKCAERTLPWLNQLERQEPKLSSQAFSIYLSHCLVNKAKGYALADERGKNQQALEQLRIRADKRNSLEIAGAFCHGVKESMSFIAEQDEKLAAKLLRQVQDMSNKYHLEDLAFACAARVWAHCPEVMPLEQLLKKISQLQQLDGFNYEVYFMLHTLAMQPLERQIGGYVQIWHTLNELNRQSTFASGLNQVSMTLAKAAPKRYELWLHGCQSLLDNEASLQHTKRLLLAVQQYLLNDCDIHQFLVLPKEIRTLVVEALR